MKKSMLMSAAKRARVLLAVMAVCGMSFVGAGEAWAADPIDLPSGNNTVSGDNSIGIGNGNTLNGSGSIGIGNNNEVLGRGALVVGYENTINEGERYNDSNASVFGNNNTVRRNSSVLGYGNTVGSTSSVVGNSNVIQGDTSIALGRGNKINGNSTRGNIALGEDNIIDSACYVTSIGRDNNVTGNYSAAFGINNEITADNAIAIGNGAKATIERTVSFGNADDTTKNMRLVNLADGVDDSDAATVGQLKKAVGEGNTINGWHSTGIGYDNVVDNNGTSANNATAIGSENIASCDYTTVVGYKNEASKDKATAIGYSNNAKAAGASAIGVENYANGGDSTAMGYWNRAQKDLSSAIGYGNETNAGFSSAFGYQNIVTGNNSYYSNAFGSENKVEGQKSSAFGYGNTVAASNALAIGVEAKATEERTVSFGDVDDTTKNMRLVNIANGINANDAATVGQVQKMIESGSGVDLTGLHEDLQAENPDDTTVVSAFNKVDDKANANAEAIKEISNASQSVGDIADLDSDIKADTTVGAINNVNSKVDMLGNRVDKLDSKVNKVGAGAAALAALHPMDFDPDNKLTFSAGVGNYHGENAMALGAFYRPDEKVMFSLAGNMGNGENMINAGITFALDRTHSTTTSKAAMAKKLAEQEDKLAAQDAKIARLEALVEQLSTKVK